MITIYITTIDGLMKMRYNDISSHGNKPPNQRNKINNYDTIATDTEIINRHRTKRPIEHRDIQTDTEITKKKHYFTNSETEQTEIEKKEVFKNTKTFLQSEKRDLEKQTKNRKTISQRNIQRKKKTQQQTQQKQQQPKQEQQQQQQQQPQQQLQQQPQQQQQQQQQIEQQQQQQRHQQQQIQQTNLTVQLQTKQITSNKSKKYKKRDRNIWPKITQEMLDATLAQIHNKQDINNTDHTNTTTKTIFLKKLPITNMETPTTERKIDIKTPTTLGRRSQETKTTQNINNSVTTSIIKYQQQNKTETTTVNHNNVIIPTTTKTVQNIVKEYDEKTPKKENKYTTTPNTNTGIIIDQITTTSNNTDVDFKKVTQEVRTQIQIENKDKTIQKQQINNTTIPNTQNNLSNNNIPKPVPKTKPPPQVIVDNMITTIPDEQIIQITKNIFKDKIKNIRILKLGGMLITPSDQAATNSLLKADNYPTATYGHDLYIHLTTDKTDTRP